MRTLTLSRFKNFTDTLFVKDDKFLQGDQYYNGCILRFNNGLLSNDGKDRPAVECMDAHIEYWENGKLHNYSNKPAIITNYGDSLEYWENGKKINNKKEAFYQGNIAEIEFANYLNNNNIAFIHLDQIKDIFSKSLRKKKQKRPDYIIFEDNNISFIDVKARTLIEHHSNHYFRIDKKDLNKLQNLKNMYKLNILISFIDIKKIFNHEYKFISISLINEHFENIKKRETYINNLPYIIVPDIIMNDCYYKCKENENDLLKKIEYNDKIFDSDINVIYNTDYEIEFIKYLESLGYYKKENEA